MYDAVKLSTVNFKKLCSIKSSYPIHPLGLDWIDG